ncbi:MAG: hypothetical protein ISN29_12720, partial [Gammaproteobacteria bacterium AqS3]|nr:hypothetical protein [Gammaproteobacteria bacterium AqS3]
MRSLDDLATIQSGITLTRDNRERLVTITGGVLKVNTWLDTSSIAPGWRILCKSSGGLAFDAPDFSSTGIDITPTSVFASYLNVSVDDFDRVQAGDPFTVENDGGYTGPASSTTYYVGKSEASPGSNAILIAYKTKAAALSNSNNADDYIAWSGSGTASDVVLAFASRTGRLDIGTIGADGEPQIQIIEDETAHKFGGDNYASNSSVSRFQSGKVEFNNVFWAVDTNQSATRSDFDIYMGDSSGANMPEVTLNNCKIVTDTRFNHFGSNQLTINGLDFTNTNTDAPTGAEVEFVLPPASMTDLNLKSPSKGIRVLPFSQPNDTPIVLQNLTGGTKIGTVDHVPTGRNSQIVGEGQNKYVHTIDLAGEITRVANERVGNVRDLRTVNFQFDDIAPSLIADQEIKIKATSSGFPTVAITNPLTLTIDSSGQTSGVLLYKNFGHASATGAHNNTYQLTVNTP